MAVRISDALWQRNPISCPVYYFMPWESNSRLLHFR